MMFFVWRRLQYITLSMTSFTTCYLALLILACISTYILHIMMHANISQYGFRTITASTSSPPCLRNLQGKVWNEKSRLWSPCDVLSGVKLDITARQIQTSWTMTVRARHSPGNHLPQRVPVGTLSWPSAITGNKLENSRNVLQLPTESTLLLLSGLGVCITLQV